jgi:hypothetical protein
LYLRLFIFYFRLSTGSEAVHFISGFPLDLRLFARFQAVYWIRGCSLDFRLSIVCEAVHYISGSQLNLSLFVRFEALHWI